MTVLRDLLDTPEAAAALRADVPRAETQRRDMAGAPLDPEARFVDMTGTRFPEAGPRMGAASTPVRAAASTRGLGGWYVAGLLTLALVVGGLDMAIRNHNHDVAAPSNAAPPAATPAS